MVQKIELESNERATSVERSIETSRKVQNVIQHLITKENILMVTQEAKVKNERFLALNINVDLSYMGGLLQGANEPVYWKPPIFILIELSYYCIHLIYKLDFNLLVLFL